MDHTKYPTILSIVKAVLATAHGIAEVEKGFSNSGKTFAADRTRLSETSINNLQIATDVLRMFGSATPYSDHLFIYKFESISP